MTQTFTIHWEHQNNQSQGFEKKLAACGKFVHHTRAIWESDEFDAINEKLNGKARRCKVCFR